METVEVKLPAVMINMLREKAEIIGADIGEYLTFVLIAELKYEVEQWATEKMKAARGEQVADD